MIKLKRLLIHILKIKILQRGFIHPMLANLRVVNSNSKYKKNSKSKKNISNSIKGYDFTRLQNKLIHEGIDISKSVTEKNFNLFELKELMGYNNVLPIMGRVIWKILGFLMRKY